MVEDGLRIMNHSERTYSNIDMEWEKANGARSLADFTKIVLRDINHKTFTLTIEKGYPFGGFLMVLTYIEGLFRNGK
jgi:hypothetical protein